MMKKVLEAIQKEKERNAELSTVLEAYSKIDKVYKEALKAMSLSNAGSFAGKSTADITINFTNRAYFSK
jgi:hypothetical protein